MSRPESANRSLSSAIARLDLIERLYEAAVTPAVWPLLASELSAAMGGPALLLALRRPAAGDVSAVVGAGIEPEFLRTYCERASRDERWVPWTVELPPGAVISVNDLLAEQAFMRTAFCAEWMRPQRLLPSPVITAVILTDAGRPSTTLTVFRPWGAGPIGHSEVELLRWLMPHLQRAVTIHDELAAARTRRGEIAPHTLQARYGLTAGEARVAFELAHGRSPAEIGVALGICINTVRVHLRQVFAKTGTNRQGALVHRLLTEEPAAT